MNKLLKIFKFITKCGIVTALIKLISYFLDNSKKIEKSDDHITSDDNISTGYSEKINEQDIPTSDTDEKQEIMPLWLKEELDNFRDEALAYNLGKIMNKNSLSTKAQCKYNELNLKVLFPPNLILGEKMKKENCSNYQLNQYLKSYYKELTGTVLTDTNMYDYPVRMLLMKQAEQEAEKLQNSQ